LNRVRSDDGLHRQRQRDAQPAGGDPQARSGRDVCEHVDQQVYGDLANYLPLIELETRLELPQDHHWYRGIDTTMSIDSSTHSLFGVSKAAGDLLTQEYGR
jgi:hypothetical protein